jgi:hypothetical protein
MSGFQLFNFSPLTSWRSTFQVFFQRLRKISFATSESFAWETFNPAINFNGMTATAYQLNSARSIALGNTFLFNFDFQVTLAAPFTNSISITLPVTSRADLGTQANLYYLAVAGVPEAAIFFVDNGSNSLGLFRANFGNYTASTIRVIGNGVLEVR